jgi:hypothetical protein
MTFFYRAAWQVQFTEADGNTPLPRTFTFADPERSESSPLGEACGTCEARQVLQHVRLTPEQYRTRPNWKTSLQAEMEVTDGKTKPLRLSEQPLLYNGALTRIHRERPSTERS